MLIIKLQMCVVNNVFVAVDYAYISASVNTRLLVFSVNSLVLMLLMIVKCYCLC